MEVLKTIGQPRVTRLEVTTQPATKSLIDFVGIVYESPNGDLAILVGYSTEWDKATQQGHIEMAVQQVEPHPDFEHIWRRLYTVKKFPRTFAFA